MIALNTVVIADDPFDSEGTWKNSYYHMTTTPAFSLTIDTDWAPDPLIEMTREYLDAAGTTATFFVTNETTVNFGRHEVALHPNINGLLAEGTPIAQQLVALKQLFPNARGIRGHSLCNSTRYYPDLAQAGMVYESSHLQYGVHDLRPYWMIEGIVQLPMFFEDDLHMDLAARYGHKRFSLEALDLMRGGLKIFDFHPVHLFLNTDDLSRYTSSKEHYHDPERLAAFRNTDSPGVRTFFGELLEWFTAHHITPLPLGSIVDAWKSQQEKELGGV